MNSRTVYELERGDEDDATEWNNVKSNNNIEPLLSFTRVAEYDDINNNNNNISTSSPNTSAEFMNNSLTNVASYINVIDNNEHEQTKRDLHYYHKATTLEEASNEVNEIANAYMKSLMSEKEHDVLNLKRLKDTEYMKGKDNYEYFDGYNLINDEGNKYEHFNSEMLAKSDANLLYNDDQYNYINDAQSTQTAITKLINKPKRERNVSSETSLSSLMLSMSSSTRFPFWWNTFASACPTPVRDINSFWQKSIGDDYYFPIKQKEVYSYEHSDNKIISDISKEKCNNDIYNYDNDSNNNEFANNILYNKEVNSNVSNEQYEYSAPNEQSTSNLKAHNSAAKELSNKWCNSEKIKEVENDANEAASWEEFKDQIDTILGDLMILKASNNSLNNSNNISNNYNNAISKTSNDKRKGETIESESSSRRLHSQSVNNTTYAIHAKPVTMEFANNTNATNTSKIKSILMPTRRRRWSLNTFTSSLSKDANKYNDDIRAQDKLVEVSDMIGDTENVDLIINYNNNNRNNNINNNNYNNADELLENKTSEVSNKRKTLSSSCLGNSPTNPLIECTNNPLTKFTALSSAKTRSRQRERRVSLITESNEYSLTAILESKIKEQETKASSNTPLSAEAPETQLIKRTVDVYDLTNHKTENNSRRPIDVKHVYKSNELKNNNKVATLAEEQNQNLKRKSQKRRITSTNLQHEHYHEHPEQQHENESNEHTQPASRKIGTHEAEKSQCHQSCKGENPKEVQRLDTHSLSQATNVREYYDSSTPEWMNSSREYFIYGFESERQTTKLSEKELEQQKEHRNDKSLHEEEEQQLAGKHNVELLCNKMTHEHQKSLILLPLSRELLSDDYTLPYPNKESTELLELTTLLSQEKEEMHAHHSDYVDSIEEKFAYNNENDFDGEIIKNNYYNINDKRRKVNEQVTIISLQNANNHADERQSRINDYMLRRKTERLLEEQRRRRQQIAEEHDSREYKFAYREISHRASLLQKRRNRELHHTQSLTESNEVYKKKVLEDIDYGDAHFKHTANHEISPHSKNIPINSANERKRESIMPNERVYTENKILRNPEQEQQCESAKRRTPYENKFEQEKSNRVQSILVQVGARGLRRNGVDIRVIDECTIEIVYFNNEQNEHKQCEPSNSETSYLSVNAKSENEVCTKETQSINAKRNQEGHAFKFKIDEHIQVSRSDGSRLYSLQLLQMARKFVSGYDVCLLILTTSSAHFVVQQAYNELTQAIVRRQPTRSIMFVQIMYLFDDFVVDLSNGNVNATPTPINVCNNIPVLDLFVRNVAMVEVDNMKQLSKLVHNAYNLANTMNSVFRTKSNTSNNNNNNNNNCGSEHFIVTRLIMQQVVKIREPQCNETRSNLPYKQETESIFLWKQTESMHVNGKYDVLLSSCYICDTIFSSVSSPIFFLNSVKEASAATRYLNQLIHSPHYSCVLCAVNSKDNEEALHVINLQQEISNIVNLHPQIRSVYKYLISETTHHLHLNNKNSEVNEQEEEEEHYQSLPGVKESTTDNDILSKETVHRIDTAMSVSAVTADDINKAKRFALKVLEHPSWFNYEHVCMHLEHVDNHTTQSETKFAETLSKNNCLHAENVIVNDFDSNSINNKNIKIDYNNAQKECNNTSWNVISNNEINAFSKPFEVQYKHQRNKALLNSYANSHSDDNTSILVKSTVNSVSNDRNVAAKFAANGVLQREKYSQEMKNMSTFTSDNKKDKLNATYKECASACEHKQKKEEKEEEEEEEKEEEEEEVLETNETKKLSVLLHSSLPPLEASSLSRESSRFQKLQHECLPLTSHVEAEEEQICLHERRYRPHTTSALTSTAKCASSLRKMFIPLTGTFVENNKACYQEDLPWTSRISKNNRYDRHFYSCDSNSNKSSNNNNNDCAQSAGEREHDCQIDKLAMASHNTNRKIKINVNANVSEQSDAKCSYSNTSSSFIAAPLLSSSAESVTARQTPATYKMSKTNHGSNNSMCHESSSSFFSLLNNIHTVVMLDSCCKDTVTVTHDGNTIIATTEDDFEEHEVDEVIEVKYDKTTSLSEYRLLLSSSLSVSTIKAAKTFLQGCNVAVLSSESCHLHTSYQFVCTIVQNILTMLREHKSHINGKLLFSIVRVEGKYFSDVLASDNATKPLQVAVSPLFGSCVHDCVYRDLSDLKEFEEELLLALDVDNKKAPTNESKRRVATEQRQQAKKSGKEEIRSEMDNVNNITNSNANSMIFCSIVAKLRTSTAADSEHNHVRVCSLTATFVGVNIDVYRQLLLLPNNSLIPHTLLHHTLGGPCYTIALLGLCATEERAQSMLLTLDKLGNVVNRPLRSGSVSKFIIAVHTELEPALREKLQLSTNELEKDALMKILNRLLEMRNDAEQLLTDFDKQQPKAYLLSNDNDSLNVFLTHISPSLTSYKSNYRESKHEIMLEAPSEYKSPRNDFKNSIDDNNVNVKLQRTIGEMNAAISPNTFVHTERNMEILVCIEDDECDKLESSRTRSEKQKEETLQRKEKVLHVKQNAIEYIDDSGNVSICNCDEVVKVNRKDDKGVNTLLHSKLLCKLTESYFNGKHIQLLASDSISCAMTPVVLRRVIHNILRKSNNIVVNKHNNAQETCELLFFTSIVLIKEFTVIDLLADWATSTLSSNALTTLPHWNIKSLLSSNVAFQNETFAAVASDVDFDLLLSSAITKADKLLQCDNPGLFVTTVVAVPVHLVKNEKANKCQITQNQNQNQNQNQKREEALNIISAKKPECNVTSQKQCDLTTTTTKMMMKKMINELVTFTSVAMFDGVHHIQHLLCKDEIEPNFLLERLSAKPNHTLVFTCIRDDKNDEPLTFLKTLQEIKILQSNHTHRNHSPKFSENSKSNLSDNISKVLRALRLQASKVTNAEQLSYVNKRISEIEKLIAEIGKTEKESELRSYKEEPQNQRESRLEQKQREIANVNIDSVMTISESFVPLGAAGLNYLTFNTL